MMDFRLLNGYQKATIIERFNGETIILYWEKGQLKRKEMDDNKNPLNRKQALEFIEKNQLEINISHLAGPNDQERKVHANI